MILQLPCNHISPASGISYVPIVSSLAAEPRYDSQGEPARRRARPPSGSPGGGGHAAAATPDASRSAVRHPESAGWPDRYATVIVM